MLSFFPRGVLDEILNLIESVSEGFFPTLLYTEPKRRKNISLKDGLPYLFHSFRNKYFNKISLGNLLYFQNKLQKF